MVLLICVQGEGVEVIGEKGRGVRERERERERYRTLGVCNYVAVYSPR